MNFIFLPSWVLLVSKPDIKSDFFVANLCFVQVKYLLILMEANRSKADFG